MTAEKAVPWVIVFGLILLAGGVFGPSILFALQTLQQILLAAIGLGVTVWIGIEAVPIVRRLMWGVHKAAIAAMPIETLEVGLKQIDDRIAKITEKIAQGKAAYARMSDQIEKAKGVLKPERYEANKKRLANYAELIERQESARSAAKRTRIEIGQQVEAAKVELALGKGFADAAAVLTAGNQTDTTSDMNVAFESVNKVLVEAQASLEMALADSEEHEMQQVEVHEVKPAQASLPPAQTPMDGMAPERPGSFIRRSK